MVLNKVVLVGAGNVNVHLGKAMKRAGFEVLQVYSRTVAAASGLAQELGTAFTVSMDELCADADVYVVALKDAVLQELIPHIVKANPEAVFVHTAGSMPMQVWEVYAQHYGVLYPMQTFSKRREVDFSSVPFFVEADGEETLRALKVLAGRLSPNVHDATSEQRRFLHLAAVFACNFSNHMYALCHRLLESNGLPFEVMLPLIDETARKVHELSPAEAQTGPAIRYDKNVIDKHLELLEGNPELQDLYEKISKSIYRNR